MLYPLLSSIPIRDERKFVAQLWRSTILGQFSSKIVLWLWCSLSKNCGRGWGGGGQNLKIVVVVGVGVVIFGKFEFFNPVNFQWSEFN